jgi:cytochrome c biogenesis protein CcdA/thiol-disulfide isomerase/thioredoxin
MLLLIGFAFLAGLVTVLSPCILPLLPIVLSGSLGGGKRRPVGVMIGFILSFTIFTLFLTQIVGLLGIPADLLRNLSIVILVVFGFTLLIPQVQLPFERLMSKMSRFAPTSSKDGFLGGLVLGTSLGLLWTPCVGPILAAVISLAITGSVSGSAVVITLAYALGTAIPMTAVVYGGRSLLNRVDFLVRNTKKIQQGFGVMMIATAIMIYGQWDRSFQSWVLDTFPRYGTGLTKFEEVEVVDKALEGLDKNEKSEDELKPTPTNADQLAPSLEGGVNWIQSEPLTLNELKGKVVLVDFWTYSCINCIRTLPYVTKWDEKYKDEGLVIVGVHAPEFEFEKETENVVQAMADFGIKYPVVQDNEFNIWRAYKNRYWPAKYLIDKEGKIRYTHFGEGKYDETENKIRELLGEEIDVKSEKVEEEQVKKEQTGEIYLGYSRANNYSAETQLKHDEFNTYQVSMPLSDDRVGLRGDWKVEEEKIVAGKAGAELELNFLGSQVYLVMKQGNQQDSGKVQVLVDEQKLARKFETKDVTNGALKVMEPRKYDLVDMKEDYGRYRLRLVVSEGVELYAFTFGSS